MIPASFMSQCDLIYFAGRRFRRMQDPNWRVARLRRHFRSTSDSKFVENSKWCFKFIFFLEHDHPFKYNIYIYTFLIICKGKGWLNPLSWALDRPWGETIRFAPAPTVSGNLGSPKKCQKIASWRCGFTDSVSSVTPVHWLFFVSLFFDIFTDETSTREFYDPSLCWLNWWHPTCCWWILLKAWEPGDRGAAPVTGNGNGNGNGSRVGRTQESGRIFFEMSERKV